MAAALDPERLREIMHELFNRSASVVQRYQGTVDSFTGDGLMAIFGAPVALEDHAADAPYTTRESSSPTARRISAHVPLRVLSRLMRGAFGVRQLDGAGGSPARHSINSAISPT